MNLYSSSQREMVYWLVPCCNRIGGCVPSYGWPCFQKILVQFDCIFVQGLIKWENPFLQCEFIDFRWITQTVRHSNEAGDSTAGT